jgi:hypothetical protein
MSLLDYLLGPPAENAEKKILPETSPLPPHSPPRRHPPLGSKNDLGEMVMTIEDLPELEYRLRVSGWRVERRGNELIYRSGRRLRVQ